MNSWVQVAHLSSQAPWEAEIGRIPVQANLAKKFTRLLLKEKIWAWGRYVPVFPERVGSIK
jgi:hypothetical protein